MKGTKEIRSRIKAINNTAKITRAMQLVASSKMRKAQDLAVSSRPYMLLLTEIAENISKLGQKKLKHPFFERREVQTRGILVIGSDKGLCGALNQNITKFVNTEIDDFANTKFISIGKKVTNLLLLAKRNVISHFNVSDRTEYHELSPIVSFIKKIYLDGEIDSLDIIFAQYINPLVQEPVVHHVLPMMNFENELKRFRTTMNLKSEYITDDPRPTIVEPSVSEVLDILSQMFLSQNIYRIVLEAKASEHSSRMIAMKSATDNAEALAKDLSLEYNKLRQSAITNEIIEISAARE